jgi:hypothetical protein
MGPRTAPGFGVAPSWRSAIVLRGSRPGTGRGENRDPRTEPATGKRDTGKTWTEFAPDSALRKPDRTVGPRSR